MKRLKNISKKIRKKIIYLSHKAKTAHLASSLSCVDIMVTIYEDFLKFNKNKISKNIFILSKGHAAMALYSILNYKNIISNNTNLFGAGFHKITNKGFLNLHTDFNNYNDPINGSLDRRINLLIYLNDNWKDEYNGHLLLCDKNNNSITHKISPILNRCVIFNTTSYSIHGHPDRLNVPDNISRDSLSLYYYTKNINGDTCFEGNEFHCTKYYKKSLFN